MTTKTADPKDTAKKTNEEKVPETTEQSKKEAQNKELYGGGGNIDNFLIPDGLNPR